MLLAVCARFFLVCVHAPRTRTHAHVLVACIYAQTCRALSSHVHTRAPHVRGAADLCMRMYACACMSLYACTTTTTTTYEARVCARVREERTRRSVCAIAISFAEQSVYFMKTLTREREQPSLGRRGFGGAGYASPGSNLPCASFLTLQRRLSFLKEVGRKGVPLVSPPRSAWRLRSRWRCARRQCRHTTVSETECPVR